MPTYAKRYFNLGQLGLSLHTTRRYVINRIDDIKRQAYTYGLIVFP